VDVLLAVMEVFHGEFKDPKQRARSGRGARTCRLKCPGRMTPFYDPQCLV
jgi:hypothetical protein